MQNTNVDKPTPQPLSETFPVFLGRADADQPFDVVIVGSGYGGSVAAHSIAAAVAQAESNGQDFSQLRVLLLERGKQFNPGDFPSTFGELPGELRLAQQDSGNVSGHEGLFDVRMGKDVVAMVANGLGGGSLINAGVLISPEPSDIENTPLAHEPHRQALVNHLRVLHQQDSFTRARRLLGGQVKRNGQWVSNDRTRWPHKLQKIHAYEDLANRAKPPFKNAVSPVEITVNFDGQPNLSGVQRSACVQCGDCMTGCNEDAKESLDRGLLAWAKRRLGDRLTIVTGASVASLVRDKAARGDGGPPDWRLRTYHTDPSLQGRDVGSPSAPGAAMDFNNDGGRFIVRAKRVVLAAGTFGSTEILLRSRTSETMFSPRLGESFSGNGDDIAAVHRLPGVVNSGADERIPRNQRGVGPTTTSRVTLKGAHRPFQVEEFSVPGPVKRLFEETVTTGWAVAQMQRPDRQVHANSDEDPLAVDPDAMQKTLLVGVVGHDTADGLLQLPKPLRPRDAAPQLGALCIHWPQARHGKEFDDAHETLRNFAHGKARAKDPDPETPVLVTNPMWRLLPDALAELVTQPRGPVLTVHPLGGCRIGANAEEGVVDALGRVFNANPHGAQNLFDSLVVLDGSVIGSSLGVNPALTITALALHAMDHHVSAWGLGTSAHDPETETEANRTAKPGQTELVTVQPCTPNPAAQGQPQSQPPAPLPSRTSLSVTERLWGAVSLGGTVPAFVLELTLAFEAQPVSTLIGKQRQPMTVKPQDSRLRLFAASQWQEQHLHAASDAEREPFVLFESMPQGSMTFLHREPSTPCQRKLRSLWAWVLNRGMRDTWQRFFEPKRHGEPTVCFGRSDLANYLALASRNGQRRLFDYDLTVGQVLKGGPDLPVQWKPADPLKGQKQLGYARRASPWTQLTELQLHTLPGLARPATLKLDARFLARQGKPLLHIEAQHDHAEAMAELLSFGLYMLRVLIHTHLWSFRKPDPRREFRQAWRLPGDVPGLPAPAITNLVVDRWRADDDAPYQDVTVRLTRYAAHGQQAQPKGKPLVMLHGYSASGTTFTHPTLACSAAVYFAKLGRDVWVVDLRTSCGMPSAVLPWAMEQPALVDIPAALLHIRKLTGQRVDVLAHCIGGAMLGMALLADAEAVRKGEIELGGDTWLTSEHLGTLAAFNGDVTPGRTPAPRTAHPTVDRIVLSQKGPLVRYTDENLFRAFALQYLRRWLLPPVFSFQGSRAPGVAEQLMDRFLSSLPYPERDFDTENPTVPWQRTEWVATRHRVDALFGRTFSSQNLREETLDAIDDIFGPINMDTVSQTIHFARFDAITNQRGRGEFVTRKRLRERWAGIQTMALHGQDNGLADPYTQELLHQQLGQAGVPLHKVPLIRGTGHQDTLIGHGAHRIFDAVNGFFDNRHLAQVQEPTPGPALVATEPWMGPRLVPHFVSKAVRIPAANTASGRSANLVSGVRLAVMSAPDQGPAQLWLFAAARQPGVGGKPPVHTLLRPGHSAVAGDSGDNQFWLFAQPGSPPLVASGPQGAQVGWLAVLVYALEQTTARPARMPPTPPTHSALPIVPGPGFPLNRRVIGASTQTSTVAAVQPHVVPSRHFELSATSASNRLLLNADRLQFAKQMAQPRSAVDLNGGADRATTPPDVLRAVVAWFNSTGAEALDACFVTQAAIDNAAQLLQTPEPTGSFSFALASCQYPYGLFDRQVADASLRKLANEPVALALMVGDQIYADASAGLVDPSRADELYDQPHERAFRLEGMRAVMRNIPIAMLLDDHELANNWQPLPQVLPDSLRRVKFERKRLEKTRRNGVRAYMRYQRMENPDTTAGKALAAQPQDQAFAAGGCQFFLLDTRSGRERGAPSDGPTGSIISHERMVHLQAWLLQHRNAVKFIVSPSMLLPQRLETLGQARNACRADAWDGFPNSVADLLNFMEWHGIRKTVFLSGDEHHSLHQEAFLGSSGVKVVSVHGSALYAPYPFANGKPQDLALKPTTQLAPRGDGYVVLKVFYKDAVPVLEITYVKADVSASTATATTPAPQPDVVTLT